VKKYKLQNRGMTLVELLVGASIFAVVSIGGIMLYTQQKKEDMSGSIEILAASTAEDFFSQRRKVFQTAFEDEAGSQNCRNNLASTGLPDKPCRLEWPDATDEARSAVFDNAVGACPTEISFAGLRTFRDLTIPTSGCLGGQFTETIGNICQPIAVGDNRIDFTDQNANFSGLSKCEKELIRACGAPDCSGKQAGPGPGLDADGYNVNSYDDMRVRITRVTSTGTSTIDFPTNNQQGIIGAAVCMIPNGDTGAYTGINFRLLLLLKDANNRIKLMKTETSFARPILKFPDSIIPEQIGCDKTKD